MLSERNAGNQEKMARWVVIILILPSNCEGGSVRSRKDAIEPYSYAAASLHKKKINFGLWCLTEGGGGVRCGGGSDHAYQ
jgi:hypothetical protein